MKAVTNLQGKDDRAFFVERVDIYNRLVQCYAAKMQKAIPDVTLSDDITKEEGVTYVFEITYTEAVSKGQTTIRPFLWRKQDNGKQLEVHLPWVDPTLKADKSLFGTEDDRSDSTVTKSNGQKMYYVGESIFPFAFHLEGASVDVFKNTILKRENESKRIDTFFPEFLEWSKSNGKTNEDWYLHPSE